MFCKPTNVVLKVGTPYVIELVNIGKMKHEYTSETFFPTMAFRKAGDSTGEYKTPLLKEAEVFEGKQLNLYVIPTKAGTFKIVCALPGHEQAGMVGSRSPSSRSRIGVRRRRTYVATAASRGFAGLSPGPGLSGRRPPWGRRWPPNPARRCPPESRTR